MSAKLHPELITRSSMNDLVRLLEREEAARAFQNRSRSQRKNIQGSAKQEQALTVLHRLAAATSVEAQVLMDQIHELWRGPAPLATALDKARYQSWSRDEGFAKKSANPDFIERWFVVDAIWFGAAANDLQIGPKTVWLKAVIRFPPPPYQDSSRDVVTALQAAATWVRTPTSENARIAGAWADPLWLGNSPRYWKASCAGTMAHMFGTGRPYRYEDETHYASDSSVRSLLIRLLEPYLPDPATVI